MNIEEQVRVLCVRCHITMAELARRIGTSPQNLSVKLKRQTFKISELEEIAAVLDCKFEHNFILPNGEKI